MAVRLDAAGDYLQRTANLPTNTAFTVCGWSRIISDQGALIYQPIVTSINGSYDGWAIEWSVPTASSQMQVACRVSGSDTSIAAFASRPAVGTDFFWYIKCSGTGANQCEGGWRPADSNTFVTATATMSASAGASDDLRLGNLDSWYYLDGRFWNVKCWDRALTAAELLIESYYARPMFQASANFWWPLPNSGNTADASGNGRNATVGGTLATEDGIWGQWKPGSSRVFIPSATNVTKALTGVAGTGAVGSVAPAISYAVTGNAATGAAGTVVDAVSYALSGNALTGAVGTVAPALSVALTGVVGTGAAGTPRANVTYGLTGIAGTGAVGGVAPEVRRALTGVAATGAVGTVVSNIVYGLTGVAGTGAVGTVTATTGVTHALTGVAATGAVGAVGPEIACALTGVAATGAAGTLAGAVSYGLSGNLATGAVGSVGVNVTYALTGVQATGAVGTLTAEVTGNDVTKALTGVQATGQVGNVTAVGGAAVARVHGFEIGDDEPARRRRNLITIVKQAEATEEGKPRVKITKREIDRRLFERARDEARAVIAKAAEQHAATKRAKAERFAQVRTALKPLASTLGAWNWIAVYQRMYEDALNEALRQELIHEDALAQAADEANERALMELVMEWM